MAFLVHCRMPGSVKPVVAAQRMASGAMVMRASVAPVAASVSVSIIPLDLILSLKPWPSLKSFSANWPPVVMSEGSSTMLAAMPLPLVRVLKQLISFGSVPSTKLCSFFGFEASTARHVDLGPHHVRNRSEKALFVGLVRWRHVLGTFWRVFGCLLGVEPIPQLQSDIHVLVRTDVQCLSVDVLERDVHDGAAPAFVVSCGW